MFMPWITRVHAWAYKFTLSRARNNFRSVHRLFLPDFCCSLSLPASSLSSTFGECGCKITTKQPEKKSQCALRFFSFFSSLTWNLQRKRCNATVHGAAWAIFSVGAAHFRPPGSAPIGNYAVDIFGPCTQRWSWISTQLQRSSRFWHEVLIDKSATTESGYFRF